MACGFGAVTLLFLILKHNPISTEFIDLAGTSEKKILLEEIQTGKENLIRLKNTLTITDENNCEITNSIEVTVPTPMDISIAATDANCNGESTGTLDVAITGGTTPLDYDWDNGLTSQATHNSVSAGTYTVTVTDADGCSVTESATVGEPAVLEIASLNALDVACNGAASGSIDLNVIGGIGNYTYAWDNGLGSDEDPQNVATGDYNVTITDENNCEVQGNINVSEPTALTIDILATDVLCNLCFHLTGICMNI